MRIKLKIKLIYPLLACIALQITQISTAEPINNGIYGDPEIHCSADSVKINFNTYDVFEGHLYVKGHYDQAGCRVDATNERTASITIPFTGCGIRRERSANPSGLLVTTTVVISFHPMFVTMTDRAYNVKCFYMTADKVVTANLDVSIFSTQLLTQNAPIPVCRYEVLEKGPTGSPLRYAMVGQEVYHRWTCDSGTKDVYCMTVHSCFVDDGNNKKVQLLDENGCAQDKYLMNNINYESDMQGGINNLVFKFADKPTVFFQCQIRLHHKEESSRCQRTSEACPWPTRGKRSATRAFNSTKFELMKKLDAQKEEAENFDVYTESLTVLDIEDRNYVSDNQLRKTRHGLEEEDDVGQSRTGLSFHGSGSGSGFKTALCFSPTAFGLMSIFLFIMFFACLIISLYLYVQRKRLFVK